MRSCRSLPACLVAPLTLQLVASQDDGQRAAQLAQRVAGTLPNAAAFQASATQQAGPEAAAGRLPSVAAVSCTAPHVPVECSLHVSMVRLPAMRAHWLLKPGRAGSAHACACTLGVPPCLKGAACQGQGERAQAAGRPNATAPTGILRLGLSGSGRDGYVFVPSSYQASAPSALVVALHGAGKGGLDGLGVLVDKANSSGALCTGQPASQ